MLAGRKPMAMFYAGVEELPREELIPEEAFAPHVAAGKVSRHAIEVVATIPTGKSAAVRYVLFAVIGEEWRIHAHVVLTRALYAGGGWNETCERVQGALLGYTEQEINEHCSRTFRRVAP